MARIVFLDESLFVKDLKAMKDFDKKNGIVGIADEDIEIAETVSNIIYEDFAVLIDKLPSSVFFDLRENHEGYIDSINGSHALRGVFASSVKEKQSPVRRRLF